MKKMIIFFTFVVIGLIIVNFNLMAKSKEYYLVTAYYCLPHPPLICLTFQGTGGMSISIPGELKTITIKVPKNGETVPAPPSGYDEYSNFFLFTDISNQTIGKGVMNGILHFADANQEFKVYDIESQIEFTNYSDWEQAVFGQ